MSLSKQFLSFTFNQLSQDSGSKHILPGGLVNASNCLRGQTTVSKKGPLTKRKGFSRTSPSFSGASWTDATATSGGVLPGDGSNLLGVDGSDRKWTYDSDAATWRSAGLVVPVFPRTTYAIPLNLRTTCMVEAGNNLWFFAHEYSTSANDKGWYTVIDTTSGVVIQAPTRWTLSAALPITLNEAPMLCAAYDNSSAVWVFDGASAYKFVVATPSVAPTTTAFAICTVTGAANDFTGGPHCRWLSGISKIAVVGFGRSIAPAAGAFIQVAYLNTATGLKATDVPNVSAALGADQFFNGRILVSDGSNGSWYVAMRNAAAGIGTAVTTKLFTITASTLAIAQVSITAFTMVSAAVATNPGGYGGVCGYLAANGDRVVYSTDTQLTASNVTHAGKIHRTVYTGAATSTTFFGGFITSDPVLYGGNWYLMTGLHEILANASYIGLQRSLFLRNATGEIVCQIMPGQGPSYGNTLQSAVPSASSSTAGDGQTGLKYCHVTDLIAVGTKLINGAAINELSRGLVAAKVTIDMAPVWSKPAMLSASSAVSGGGVLQTWGKADAIREASPMTYPWQVLRTAGTGTTYTSIALCYVLTDADGTIYRSSPYLGTLTFGASDTLTVTPLLWKLPGTTASIEIYGGTTTLRLIHIVASDPTVELQTVVLPTAAGLIVGGETLYTTGGALSASPPPPAISIYQWRNRIFVADVQQDPTRVSFSLERELGFGPRFNEVLAFNWRDGSGECLAFGAVDWNYLCLFKRDAVAVISGPGPDGRGAGNYTPQTLPTRHGCTALGSIVQGPGGCYYQSAATGRIVCVTSGLAVVEAAPGAYDYSTEVITAARHDEATSTIQFFTANRMIVLDYSRPTAEFPLGEVYSWSSSGLLQGFAATSDNTGPVHMEATGVLRRPETGATYQDATSTTPASYGITVESGWIQPFQLQGEFSLRGVQVLGAFRAAHTLTITTYADYSASGDADSVAVTASPEQFRTTPTGMMRINAIKVKIEETASTGAGLDLEGWGIEAQNRGREKRLNVAQRI